MRSKAPWLAAALTIALGVLFWLPLGSERGYATGYQDLAGFSGTFGHAQQAAAATAAPESPVQGVGASIPEAAGASPWETNPSKPLPLHTRTARPKGTARKEEKDSSGKGSLQARHTAQAVSGGTHKSAKAAGKDGTAAQLQAAESSTRTVAATAPVVAEPAYSGDEVRDWFEGDLSRYPMDKKVLSGKVQLGLIGLSRWKNRFILKVAVGNRGDADFFIKDFGIRDTETFVQSRSFFRLFVEPGKTREGYVVFERPKEGAGVNIVLKEDRENGRELKLPVPYSF